MSHFIRFTIWSHSQDFMCDPYGPLLAVNRNWNIISWKWSLGLRIDNHITHEKVQNRQHRYCLRRPSLRFYLFCVGAAFACAGGGRAESVVQLSSWVDTLAHLGPVCVSSLGHPLSLGCLVCVAAPHNIASTHFSAHVITCTADITDYTLLVEVFPLGLLFS